MGKRELLLILALLATFSFTQLTRERISLKDVTKDELQERMKGQQKSSSGESSSLPSSMDKDPEDEKKRKEISQAVVKDALDHHGVDKLMLLAFEKREEEFLKAINSQKKDLLNLVDDTGSGLLHWSVMGSCDACVDALIAKGFPLNQKNKRGETPLVYAVSGGELHLSEKLLKAGANPNISFNDAGYTLLMDASFEGQLELVKLLVKNEADINQVDREGLTAEDYAKREQQREIIEYYKGL